MKKPNIVFILSDQHNGLIMGNAGDIVVRTPVMDALAKSGSRMDACYCNSPLCVPSRSSLLTGRYPSDTGIFNNLNSLPSDIPTIAHCIGNAGYETILSGRMHFVGADQRHGYEKRLVGDFTWTLPGLEPANEKETLGSLMGTSFPSLIAVKKSGAGSSAVLQYDKDVTDATCQYLSERNDERPLFMTVGFYGPHAPYVAPKELYDYYYDKVRVPEVTEESRKLLHPAIQDWFTNRGVWDIDQEDIRRSKAAYYGMIEYVDSLIGKIIDSIEKELGLDNTIIVYGSDHGDTIGENGLFWKTNFYEGSVRVPLIFSCPSFIQHGNVIRNLTNLVDLAPTLIEAADGSPLPLERGISLWSYITNGGEPSERAVISQLADIKGDMPSAMIRKGDYKLVLHNGFESPQLFDLQTDPLENDDLGSNPKYEEIRNELKSILLQSWDPDQADFILAKAKKNNQILRQWTVQAGIDHLEEWRPNADVNCLF